MKILIVDNNTVHLSNLHSSLAGHEIEVQKYRPGLDFHDEGKDLVILSGGGGQGKEAADITKDRTLWYATEMEYILKSNKPIFGICMGFELIAQAHGSKVEELPELVFGLKSIKKRGLKPGRLQQVEAHHWAIQRINLRQFDVLGESATGLEIVRHKHRPIFATQFHPEAPAGTMSLKQMINSPQLLKI